MHPLATADRINYSPNEYCDSSFCSKACFARSCFDWCLIHSHPSVEDRDGTATVKTHTVTRDGEGNLVDLTGEEDRRLCGHDDARRCPGDCNIVCSSFMDASEMWYFEQERHMREMMARDSP
jgi:hypothetical protein